MWYMHIYVYAMDVPKSIFIEWTIWLPSTWLDDAWLDIGAHMTGTCHDGNCLNYNVLADTMSVVYHYFNFKVHESFL